jgi:nicotinamide-nucleotide amidase
VVRQRSAKPPFSGSNPDAASIPIIETGLNQAGFFLLDLDRHFRNFGHMKAEILSTGDEIRTGTLVDSNTAWIAECLERQGVTVTRHLSVGDDLSTLTDAITEISRRADVAVVTGGLGPTVDDRTIEAAARAAGVELVLDAAALAVIEDFFRRRSWPFSPSNRKQAMVPQGGACLTNPIGTAPGIRLSIHGCTFFFMPGVPAEMRRMLDEQVLPQIGAMQGGRREFNLLRTISTFGLGESRVGEKIAAVKEHFPEITLGLRAKFPEIQVKLYLRTQDEPVGKKILAAADDWVSGVLGQHVFSHHGRTMAEEVGRLMLARGATLALAESCTGGLAANWITNTAGSSGYFLFSGVTYHNAAKINVLGVSERTLQEKGAVSEETARQMAEGARRVAGATYGLGLTGIAGPDGGTDEKPVGTVWIALAAADGTVAKRHCFTFGQRLMNKRMFAMTALDMLRLKLVQ